MPVIHLARLKIQSARLVEKSGQPEVFLRDLLELLDSYSNRTIRSSLVAQKQALPTFRTQAPVLQQVLAELVPFCNSKPAEAVNLVSALWEGGFLETRLLAARLLGRLPLKEAGPLIELLPEWLSQTHDKQVRLALLSDACFRLRSETPDKYFGILEGWLVEPSVKQQSWGLQALIPVLADANFENLPVVFRILKPAILSASAETQIDLKNCLAALEKVSFTETLSFLRDLITPDAPPMMLRILQRIIPGFSQAMQSSLREILRTKIKR
jgi:hypothetical protein